MRLDNLFGALVAAVSVSSVSAAGINCCALGMGAGSTWLICTHWGDKKNGCGLSGGIKGCASQIKPAHKYAGDWCNWCLANPENTQCTSPVLAPFPDHPPPKPSKRDAKEVADESAEVSPDSGYTQDQTKGNKALAVRATVSGPIDIPVRDPSGVGINSIFLGALKITVTTSARGIVQLGIQNLVAHAVSYSYQDNTVPTVGTGTVPAGKTEYFRPNDIHPGDHVVFHTNV
ncbi:Hypothetical protein D9617_75g011880 [Elsinoe fawcettii]|nr:Hypothetical protein D9617_75g011880 [Elsinoe fawcettii]